MTYVTIDLETTTKTSYKRKANPFDPDNWIVLSGWKNKGSKPESIRTADKTAAKAFALLPKLLAGKTLVFGQNLKFDILHLCQNPENLEAWMDFVARGGRIWDTQLAEYLLDGMIQQSQWLSLDEIAPRYGGNVKIDEVKALWEAGVQTQDIDPELLNRYLCGGEDEFGVYQMGDLENTEMASLGQIKKASERGQLNSILLNMGAALGTIEMERNGMFVSVERALPLAKALGEKVVELTGLLKEFLPKDLPFEFSWGSPKQKSALIFGGTVQYDSREYVHGKDALGEDITTLCDEWHAESHPPIEYAKKDEEHIVLANGKTMARLLWEHLQWNPDGTDTEAVVIGSGKNKGELKTKKVKVPDLTKPKARACKAPYTFGRITEPDPAWAGADPGIWSTSAAVIEELGVRDIPFLKAMAQLQAATKDLGTYYITEELDEEGKPIPGKSKGMLTLVDILGIIHHSINQCATVTGRFSSSNPNLQNIPKGNKSDVKTVFTSRFPGGKLIQSDFSSLEIYIQAILTQCTQLIADLKAKLDMHCVRLSVKEKMPYEEVLKLAKGYKLPDGTKVEADKEWDYKRTGAKVFSFQRAYGAGPKKISESANIPLEDVEALIIAENERYPEIEPYYEALTERIKANRKPYRTIPHPLNPKITCNLGISRITAPDGKVYTFTEQPAPEYLWKRGIYASFSPTEIKNYIVQGEGGEWAKAALELAVRFFYTKRNWAGLGLLVNQVHDACYADADDRVKLEVAAALHAAMEAASDYMEYVFKWPIPVPVPSDTTWGESMADDESIPGLAALAAEYRVEIRRLFMKGYVPSFMEQLQ